MTEAAPPDEHERAPLGDPAPPSVEEPGADDGATVEPPTASAGAAEERQAPFDRPPASNGDESPLGDEGVPSYDDLIDYFREGQPAYAPVPEQPVPLPGPVGRQEPLLMTPRPVSDDLPQGESEEFRLLRRLLTDHHRYEVEQMWRSVVDSPLTREDRAKAQAMAPIVTAYLSGQIDRQRYEQELAAAIVPQP